MNRGRVLRGEPSGIFIPPAPPGIITFHTLISSVTVLSSVQSDLGITLNGSAVSGWADQTAHANSWSQSTGAAQPALNSNGLNGFPSLVMDGATKYMTAPINLPAPGTTSTFQYWVMKQVAWTTNHVFFDTGTLSGVESMTILTAVGTPKISMFAGISTNNNNGAVLGSWVRCFAYWANSTSDEFKIGSTSITGANSGNTVPGNGRCMGATLATGAPTLFANFEIVCNLYCAGRPNVSEIAALDSAVTAKYGGLVSV